MTHAEIRKQIRDIKREMKENNVRKVSIFNGGISPLEYRYNSAIFKLESALSKPEAK